MNVAENFLQKQRVLKSIHSCYDSILEIEFKNKSNKDCINKVLQKLLYERKEVAKAYIEGNFSSEKQDDLIILFSKYNEEIIRTVGLYTTENKK